MAALIEYEEILVEGMRNPFSYLVYETKDFTEEDIYKAEFANIEEYGLIKKEDILVIPFITKFSAKPVTNPNQRFVCTPETATKENLDILYGDYELKKDEKEKIGTRKDLNKYGHLEVHFPYVSVIQGTQSQKIFFRNVEKAENFCETLKNEIEDYWSNPAKYKVKA